MGSFLLGSLVATQSNVTQLRCAPYRYFVRLAVLIQLPLRAGVLDDLEIENPQMTIWTSSAPSWVVFDPDNQQDEKQSPPPQ